MTALSNKFTIVVESHEMVEEIDEQEQLDTSEMESLTAELEEEQKKIKQIQSDIEAKMRSPASVSSAGTPRLSQEEKAEADGRSVYVGNVDYSVTAEELETHFHGCGSVNRVTILCDKFSGHPKGFAYVEFSEKEGAENALSMTDSLLKGRQIKVNLKRTNKPGISTTNRGGRGRSGRGGARGGVIVKYIYAGGFSPYRGGGAGRGFRTPSRF